MHLRRHVIGPGTRVLHLAPERCLHDALRVRAGEGYMAADFEPSRYSFAPDCRAIDLCDLDDWPTGAFDLIVHSHVMEHIPCTLAYPLYHLHRMLASEGRHICIIPFMPGHYDETFAEIGDAERNRRFGQADHVRRFGAADRKSHLGKLLTLPETYDPSALFGREALDRARIPESQWRGFTIATVLELRRSDMRLLGAA
jgi:phosphoglycolate phosphatase